MSNPKKRKQGSVLKQKRMEAGLTQEKAIEYLGFSLRSLQAYEKGESTPSLAKAVKMARLYGCKVDDLTERKENDAILCGAIAPPCGGVELQHRRAGI